MKKTNKYICKNCRHNKPYKNYKTFCMKYGFVTGNSNQCMDWNNYQWQIEFYKKYAIPEHKPEKELIEYRKKELHQNFITLDKS